MTIDRVSSINVSRVLHMFYTHGPVCRPDISRMLGVDRSTVTKIVSSLVDRSLVQLLDKRDSTPRGGRKAVFLDFNYDIGHVVGIELQTDSWFAVVVSLRGTVLRTFSGELTNAQGIEPAVQQIAQQLQDSIRSLQITLLGIVVSVPGIVTPHKGQIIRSNPLNIDEPVDITATLRPYFGVPVLVENDANSCCWAELFRRRENAPNDFLCVLVEFRRTKLSDFSHHGIGVGLGIVVDKTVRYGPHHSAGEFQSVFCNSPHSTQFSISDEDAERITESDEVLDRTFHEFALNASLLVNVFDLSEVVVVGDLARKKDSYGAMLQHAIKENWPYDSPPQCAVTFTELGRETVAFGAACMFIQRLFTVPSHDSDQKHQPCGIDLLNSIYQCSG